MVYTFGLEKHANTRYRDSLIRLSCCELRALLHSLSIDCSIIHEQLGGADFLTFECRDLTSDEITFLSGHSTVVFLSVKNDALLSPLSFLSGDYLTGGLPEILKYKGKTSVSFTRMLMNIALSVSPFSLADRPLTILDPLCGKGTTCFCALQAGMNAIGLDLDRKAIREASDFFKRYLKLNLLKHTVRHFSETSGKASLPVTEFQFADSNEHYREKDFRFLRLAAGDTSHAPALCRKNKAHLIIADLPYGVQHAPQFGGRTESFCDLLVRVLPEWKKTLKSNGVAAISFNTLTLPAQRVLDIAADSGFAICDYEFCRNLRHEVEQAVVRDAVILINKSL